MHRLAFAGGGVRYHLGNYGFKRSSACIAHRADQLSDFTRPAALVRLGEQSNKKRPETGGVDPALVDLVSRR